jgi:lipoprotein NlpI
MNNRWFAILIVVCLAMAEAGCASEAQRRRNKEEILLPRQTGSNLDRRIIIDSDSNLKVTKRTESKRSSRKRVKTERSERTEPVRTEPEKPEETPTPPDRFR